jgi:hypothetical protein
MLKNITLSADDILIEEARQKAQKQKKNLNILFREWFGYCSICVRRDLLITVKLCKN